MGLATFWASLTSPRVREIEHKHRPFSYEAQEPVPAMTSIESTMYKAPTSAASMTALPRVTPRAEAPRSVLKDTQTKTSKQAPAPEVKRRRSRFGKPPAAEETTALPPMPSPARPALAHVKSQPNVRPVTAITANEPLPWSKAPGPNVEERKSRRRSLAEVLKGSRKRSKSSATQSGLERRQSVLGGHRSIIPPVPSVPASAAELINPTTGMVPSLEENVEKRKSRRLSLSNALKRGRSKSSASLKSKRGSWWQSSNPDDDHDEPPPLPPVPALVDDDGVRTPESVAAKTASPASIYTLDHNIASDGPIHMATRGSDIKQPRPISGGSVLSKHRTYSPKNAANGFLRSTSARSPYRHSLLDDGEGGMICLSDEQQREWEKLQQLMDVMEARPDTESTMTRTTEDDKKDKKGLPAFSNADALAALEFGMAK
ncbi:hypothetical protein BAUCODRAFT_142111 [Baudoinia panamericana UAMH 10762]|uniref:Uncharacterized protein n=1 Tax=Baudoinia panamericana (strain UAMH 10762) TaxID=717646 RepID=M2N4K7_BAUPA|nr:uncharacterized protein BAUCODRAFT_142111 [Baudoinia panamericana UAMH 10762]EMC93660.1 hypothetical protein BAUCODRAFT_142111 [Baudoinia panamericana UAMH 10762]